MIDYDERKDYWPGLTLEPEPLVAVVAELVGRMPVAHPVRCHELGKHVGKIAVAAEK
jgi:hypothetical protein